MNKQNEIFLGIYDCNRADPAKSYHLLPETTHRKQFYFSSRMKKIQLHFLSKKLIHSCQEKRIVDIEIDIPFHYLWY